MIIDLLKYFAKFPQRDAVLRHFARSTQKVDGYTDLKNYITGLPAALLPQITGFVTGTNDEWLFRQLKQMSSYWMLLEFGRMPMSQNKFGVLEGTLDVHVTIGVPLSGENTDMYEETLLQQATLDLHNSIITQMRTDDAEGCLFGRMLEEDYELKPIEPKIMAGSVGWIASYKRKIDAA